VRFDAGPTARAQGGVTYSSCPPRQMLGGPPTVLVPSRDSTGNWGSAPHLSTQHRRKWCHAAPAPTGTFVPIACQCLVIHTCVMRYALGTSVGERGQITIEREIREKLGVRPRDIAVQRVLDGRLVVEFVRPHEPHMRSLAGALGPPPSRPPEPVDLDDAVSRAVVEDWRKSAVTKPTNSTPAARASKRRSR
jgi:bifunctional DNA-binding transcriptional regulator/antitoxin component of YhaV-PrlF toxin-antitoxin module